MVKSLPSSVTVTSALIFVAAFIVVQNSVDVSANLLDDFGKSLNAFSLFDEDVDADSDVTDTEFPWAREKRKSKKPKEVDDVSKLPTDELYKNIRILLLKIKDLYEKFSKEGYGTECEEIVEQMRTFGYKIMYQLLSTCLTTKDTACEPCKDEKNYDPKDTTGCGDHSGNIPIKQR